MTLTEFLLARIAEDHAQTRVGAFEEMGVSTGDRDATAVMLGSFGPSRVLAECEAKRRIVALHTRTEPDEHECAGDFTGYSLTDPELSPCPTLLLLAQPYVDHPDFLPEWKP